MRLQRIICLIPVIVFAFGCVDKPKNIGRMGETKQYYQQQLADNKYDSVANFELGNLAQKDNKWGQAYAYYINAVGLDQTNQDYGVAALNLEILSRRWQLSTDRLKTLNLSAAENLYYRSKIAKGLGDFSLAKTLLIKLLEQPASQWGHLDNPVISLVNTAIRLNDSVLAESYLKLAHRHFPEHRATILAEVKLSQTISPADEWLVKHPNDVSVLFVKAQYLMAGQEFELAKIVLEKAHTLEPSHFKITLLYGENLAKLGQYQQLQRWASNLGEGNAKAQGIKAYLLGTVAFSQQEYSLAAKRLYQAAALLPAHPQLTYLRAMSLYATNDLVGALPLLEQVTVKSPTNIAALLCLAETYMGLGRPQQALVVASSAWRQSQNNVATVFTLAKTFDATGQMTKAMQLIEKSNLDAPVLVLLTARLQLKSQLLAPAEANFLKALQSNSEDTVAIVGLVDSYLLAGKVKPAVDFLLSQNSTLGRTLLATTYIKQQQYSHALKVLNQLISDADFNPIFYLLKARAEQKLHGSQYALENLPDRRNLLLLELKAQLAASSQNWQLAIDSYESLLSQGQGQAQVYNGLAWAILQLHKPDELNNPTKLQRAKQLAQRAHLREPNNKHYKHTLATIKISLQKT